MYRATLFLSGFAVLVCSALIWSAELVFPKSAASAIVLVTATVLGLWIVRPGWHLQPRQSGRNLPVLFGLLLASAAGAAWFLIFFEVPLPYDVSTLNVVASIPAILVIAGIEELLFRQVMYRWLEQRGVSIQTAIVATALAFGWTHLGPVFIGSTVGTTFYLLQSAYLVWIGILLGAIRRVTESWPMSWLGHFGYNVTVLYFLSFT